MPTVQLGSATLHYREAGGGTNVALLLHAFPLHSGMWAPQLAVKEALLTEMEHFVDCVTHGREPITSGRCGLAVVETLEAAMLSLRQRGQPIDISPARMAS